MGLIQIPDHRNKNRIDRLIRYVKDIQSIYRNCRPAGESRKERGQGSTGIMTDRK